MRILLSSAVAAIVALAYLSAQSAEKKRATPDSPADVSRKENLVGAWRLAWMEAPGSDGKLTRITNVTGMLLYTRDGHMSVQLMYPKSASDLTNDYVKNGYEASFGST
jgi:Lipocalin-like domain